MDISVIIVSYNTFDLTRQAVETALASGEREGLSFRHEVVVVDNASPDDSALRLRSAFANDLRVTIVENTVNVGFSAANNQGAAVGVGRNLFFLNPDTRTLDRTLGALVRFLDSNPQVGAVGPLVRNDDGSVQPSIMPFPSVRSLLHYHFPIADALRGRTRRTDAVPARTGPVDGVNGCALALSRLAFDEVGGWNERLFMYAEENDLCWRLKKHGRLSYFLREACIVHLGGQSSPDRYPEQQVRVQQSTLQFMRAASPHLLLPNRIAGTLSFAVRQGVFLTLSILKPAQSAAFRTRARAAGLLWRWYLWEYR